MPKTLKPKVTKIYWKNIRNKVREILLLYTATVLLYLIHYITGVRFQQDFARVRRC